MQTPFVEDGGPAVQMPLMVVAEVQDSLLVVMHDLQRLEGLLSHACDNLMDRFGEANARLEGPATTIGGPVAEALGSLRAAVTELQFQDMSSQLIVHITRVLQGCAFRLAAESMGREEGEEATQVTAIQPERPNPVTQSEMDAGSVELF
ncbi:hypothetical protein [Xylophilus sp. GOD-11R]|uniref:hypothetical protein n=1 Tax=Xylophilus sp. GOD-11R TaxID=3089814 RepID=UPI00298CD560|nr:hypothetical protein [Xylophilus sp. GOD-11R]WPB57792.1 hypothetical protein R9X41_03830 [Xylophilus sp. GOD-11R]